MALIGLHRDRLVGRHPHVSAVGSRRASARSQSPAKLSGERLWGPYAHGVSDSFDTTIPGRSLFVPEHRAEGGPVPACCPDDGIVWTTNQSGSIETYCSETNIYNEAETSMNRYQDESPGIEIAPTTEGITDT
jgi:hypothetical protein